MRNWRTCWSHSTPRSTKTCSNGRSGSSRGSDHRGSSHELRPEPMSALCRQVLANGERGSGRSGMGSVWNRLGLGAWELGGDALGLLQNRVDVLCLDEFVGLQVLEGPGAAQVCRPRTPPPWTRPRPGRLVAAWPGRW